MSPRETEVDVRSVFGCDQTVPAALARSVGDSLWKRRDPEPRRPVAAHERVLVGDALRELGGVAERIGVCDD